MMNNHDNGYVKITKFMQLQFWDGCAKALTRLAGTDL